MAHYNENLLMKGADKLLTEATMIIVTTAIKFGCAAFIFAAISLGTLVYFARDQDIAVVPWAFAMGLIGIAVGIWEGRRRSFELQLCAHKLLALVEIYRNTVQENAFHKIPMPIAAAAIQTHEGIATEPEPESL